MARPSFDLEEDSSSPHVLTDEHEPIQASISKTDVTVRRSLWLTKVTRSIATGTLGRLTEILSFGADLRTGSGALGNLAHGIQPKVRYRIVALIAGTLLAAGTLSSMPEAAIGAPSTGSISGTVTSAPSIGISGVNVTASGPSFASALTDASGNYTLTGLSSGNYRVQFQPPWGQNFVPQYWNDSPGYDSATVIPVAAGSMINSINAELVVGATVSGNVKGTGTPPINLANVQVRATPDPGSGLQGGSASTDSYGNFTIIGLAGGEYQLSYDTQQVRDFAPEVGDDLISLAPGEEVAGIQAMLAAGSTISGFISSDSSPLVGVEGVRLSVWSVAPTSVPYSPPWLETTASGEYALEGLPPGVFNVTYWAPTTPGSNLLNHSVQITVTSGSATTQDVILLEGGSVTGRVTSSGVPAEGIGVFISDGHEVWASAETDHLGNYTITKLPTGAYPIRFSDPNSSTPSALATEWWPNSSTKAGATAVAVTAGAVTTGIDVDLAAGSSISGQVAFEPDDLTSTSVIFVWDANGDVFGGDWEYGYLDTDRSYVVGGLPAGSYKVGVTDKTFGDGSPDGASDMFDEFGNLVGWEFNPGYADEKGSLASADVITIGGPNEHLTGHDVLLTVKTEPSSFSVAPTPTITGNPTVGETLTVIASTADWVPDAIFLSIRWLRDGLPIPFATYSDYELQLGDAGHEISVSVTASRIGYEKLVRESASVLIQGGLDFVTVPPTIAGTPQVGQTLTAETAPWTPEPTEVSYQWLAEGLEITDATQSTYGIAAKDLGKHISVRVTGTRVGYADATATSAATSLVAGGVLTTSTPTFSPTSPVVGDTLTAVAGSWGPAPVALSYQWERNGLDIADATQANYVVVPEDLGAELGVRVTGVKAGYVVGIENSAVSDVVEHGTIVPGVVSIDGTAGVGLELTALLGTWTPSNTTYSYVWKSNGTPIPDAIVSTYTPTADQATKTISVTVTGASSGYTPSSTTSLGVIIPAGTLTTAVPTISGAAMVGETLTADAGAWGPSGVALGYQWYANDVATPSTSSTYVIEGADNGKTITVKVTGTLDGFTTASETSAGFGPIGLPSIVAGTPTITGAAVVGGTLTANPNEAGWTPSSGLTFGYQWNADGLPIPGAADSSTLVLSESEVGKHITVTVVGATSGYGSASATSGGTEEVAEPFFADVSPGDGFFTEIQWMGVSGTSTGTVQAAPAKPLYLPAANVSRQAMAAFLYRLSGDTTFVAPLDPTFADVPADATFYTAIEWMAAEGISTGTVQESGKPLFKPTDPVSRSAMAAFLYRYKHASYTAPVESPFADVQSSSQFYNEIAWMSSTGLSTGYENSPNLPLYKSGEPVTRRAMAAFIYRIEHR